MSRGVRASIIISVTAFLVLSGLAVAQNFGRVTVVVKNDDGEPIKDVKVTVTTPALERFREEKTTNKRGKAIFSFADVSFPYKFEFEHGAYPYFETTIQPELQASITREITLSKSGSSRDPGAEEAAEAGETRVVYTPAEEVFNEGVIALQGGDLETAKAKFLQALEKDPEMGLAHSAIAGVYLELGDYEKALEAADFLLDRDPENPRGYRIRYEAQNALGNEEEAEAALKKLKQLDRGGDTVKFLYNEGVAASKVGDYTIAKERFNEALELDPKLVPAIAALAIIHINEEDWAKAAEMAERHLELDPGNVTSLRIRFDAYRQMGDTAKAKEAMDALAKADPTVVINEFMQKGVELFDGGDAAGAIEDFEQVLTLDPDHARAHYRLGIAYVSAGDTAKAKEHLQKFLELAPNDPEAATARDMLQYLE
jgi:tetratricopeptide (TPR) repeat protein